MRSRPPFCNGVPVPYDAPLADLLGAIREAKPSTGAAFIALSFCEDAESLAGLVEAARAPDPYIRRAAVEAIGHHPLGRDAEPVIHRLLTDANEYVVRSACEAAGRLHLASVHPIILRLLESSSSATRATAVRVLNDLWLPEDASVVLRLFQRERSEDVRKEAAFTLNGHVRQDSSSAIFEVFYNDTIPRHRAWACEIAGRFSIGYTTKLMVMLQDPDGHVRNAARRALAHSGGGLPGSD